MRDGEGRGLKGQWQDKRGSTESMCCMCRLNVTWSPGPHIGSNDNEGIGRQHIENMQQMVYRHKKNKQIDSVTTTQHTQTNKRVDTAHCWNTHSTTELCACALLDQL